MEALDPRARIMQACAHESILSAPVVGLLFAWPNARHVVLQNGVSRTSGSGNAEASELPNSKTAFKTAQNIEEAISDKAIAQRYFMVFLCMC